ncbi:MAG: F0F1 ATP synthase subunit A [Patescibacteria group bacterium]
MEGPVISISAEPLFHIGSFTVTNSMLLAFVTLVLFSIFAFFIRGRIKQIPGKIQNLFEAIVDALLDLMESVYGSRAKAEQYFPLIATIFLFIMISNWLGLLPGVGSIGLNAVHDGHEVFIPLFRAPAADLNFTLAIAIVSVLATNIFGIIAIGFVKHFKKFFNAQKPFPVISFVGILEFISEFVKIVSFSFRLFGNVFAGEVLLIIIAFLVPYWLPATVPFLFLELFVGFMQAFIFSMLTMVFIGMAVVDHDEHEEAHAH